MPTIFLFIEIFDDLRNVTARADIDNPLRCFNGRAFLRDGWQLTGGGSLDGSFFSGHGTDLDYFAPRSERALAILKLTHGRVRNRHISTDRDAVDGCL